MGLMTECKHSHPILRFKGTGSILTANKLPSVLRPV